MRRCLSIVARGIAGAGDACRGCQRPPVVVSLPLTSLLLTSSCRAEPAGAQRLTQHVTSSGAGRRAALACGVERSPEEYEGRVLPSGALSDVGTETRTATDAEVRSRLHGARTTPGISPRARSRSLGRDAAQNARRPERSRGVSGREWGASNGASKGPSRPFAPSEAPPLPTPHSLPRTIITRSCSPTSRSGRRGFRTPPRRPRGARRGCRSTNRAGRARS